MTDKTNYTIQLRQSRRDEWTDFVDSSSDLNTTSELIRRSVTEYIQRQDDEDGFSKEQKRIIDLLETNTDLIRDDIRDFSEVLDTIKDLQRDPDEEYEVVFNATREALKAHENQKQEDDDE